MRQEIFKFKQANAEKLEAFGFARDADIWRWETPILDGQFSMRVFVSLSGDVTTEVIDCATQDEYILHLVESSVGAFVGKVRAEYERVLTEICDRCFEKEVFISAQAKRVVAYVRSKYGDELEFLWEKFDNNAIWRRKDNRKWYGVMIVLPQDKLGIDGDALAEIIDLRVAKTDLAAVLSVPGCLPAYHMNKNSWFTAVLDGTVPDETLFAWIDSSYNLAQKK